MLGRKRAGIALGVTLAATLACASPLQGLVPGPGLGGLVTADPLSSATPTPFGPTPPTGPALPPATPPPPRHADVGDPLGILPRAARSVVDADPPRGAPHSGRPQRRQPG